MHAMPSPPCARRIASVAAIAALSLVASVEAHAQRTLTPVRVEADRHVARRNAAADRLEARAVELHSVPRAWRRAAQMHEQAAVLRGTDPRAAASWRMAAWAWVVVEEYERAFDLMEHASRAAMAVGDVELAASCNVDGALIAAVTGRGDRVADLMQQTRLLLKSPILPEDARQTILRRIGDQPLLAQAYVPQS